MRAGRHSKYTLAGLGAGLLFLGVNLPAATFDYRLLDLIAGFRQPGATYDLVVNLGSVTNLVSLAAGQTIQFNQVTPAQFGNAFAKLGGLAWSVSCAVGSTNESGLHPAQTLWLTRMRDEANTMATPWARGTASAQAQTVGRVKAVGINARNYAASGLQPEDPLFNTPAVLVIGAGHRDSYGEFVGPNGNWGNFQGNVEARTPGSFEGAQVSRLDLFELVPAPSPFPTQAGVHLGYFEFRPDATLWFTRAGASPTAPIPRPTILSVSRTEGTTRLTVSTTNDVTVLYTLLYTNLAGLNAPLERWPRALQSTPGTGSPVVLDDVTADPSRVYAVQAAR